VETVTGEENNINSLTVEDYWKKNLYFSIIDGIIINLKKKDFLRKVYQWHRLLIVF